MLLSSTKLENITQKYGIYIEHYYVYKNKCIYVMASCYKCIFIIHITEKYKLNIVDISKIINMELLDIKKLNVDQNNYGSMLELRHYDVCTKDIVPDDIDSIDQKEIYSHIKQLNRLQKLFRTTKYDIIIQYKNFYISNNNTVYILDTSNIRSKHIYIGAELSFFYTNIEKTINNVISIYGKLHKLLKTNSAIQLNRYHSLLKKMPNVIGKNYTTRIHNYQTKLNEYNNQINQLIYSKNKLIVKLNFINKQKNTQNVQIVQHITNKIKNKQEKIDILSIKIKNTQMECDKIALESDNYIYNITSMLQYIIENLNGFENTAI